MKGTKSATTLSNITQILQGTVTLIKLMMNLLVSNITQILQGTVTLIIH